MRANKSFKKTIAERITNHSKYSNVEISGNVGRGAEK